MNKIIYYRTRSIFVVISAIKIECFEWPGLTPDETAFCFLGQAMEYIREHVYQYKVALEDINIFCGDFGLYESWNKQLRFYGDEYIKAGYFQN